MCSLKHAVDNATVQKRLIRSNVSCLFNVFPNYDFLFVLCKTKKSDFLKTLLVTMFNLMQTMLHRMQKCFVSFAYSYALHKINDLGLVGITSYLFSFCTTFRKCCLTHNASISVPNIYVRYYF